MSFFDIPQIEKYEFYIDKAFGRASKKAGQMKISKSWDSEEKIKQKELKRVNFVKESLVSDLENIKKRFPAMDTLNDFYRKLADLMIGIIESKKALSRIGWARKKISEFSSIYRRKMMMTKDTNRIKNFRKEFYGRVNSVMKKVKPALEFLKFAGKEFRKFPVIKEMSSTAIVGFPNVGKSTLLYKLSGSKPEIAAYAFTTKGIMLGYISHDKEKIQLLDTPGTLNRFDKMNIIEKQAWLAIMHVADVIVYVFDLTEPFPLDMQKKLFSRLKKLGKPVIVYLSKTDVMKKDFEEFKKEYKAFTDSSKLKKKIISFL